MRPTTTRKFLKNELIIGGVMSVTFLATAALDNKGDVSLLVLSTVPLALSVFGLIGLAVLRSKAILDKPLSCAYRLTVITLAFAIATIAVIYLFGIA
ncbi:MAG TPA: hypothetical protein VFM25_02060 [Verrucomicrobiae bacterium]|nr:hypothetical protein [Verrucomicrobiae bacterium]